MASWWTEGKEWYSKQHPAVKVLVVLGGGGLGAGLGVMAAPAIGAAASVAGLGVAGGTLSGAAASSAGLAALGGGSLAAGGLGMAGGTAAVAATGGAVVAGTTAAVTNAAHRDGTRTRSEMEKARREHVTPGEIRFEE